METPAGLIIRPELNSDYERIAQLNYLAFRQPGEGKLVEALRHNPRFLKGLSLVAIADNKLIGHILFFPILIKGKGKVFRSLVLVRLAVLPGYIGAGVRSALIVSGIDEAMAGKFGSVIVPGSQDYFARFGFSMASGFGIFPPSDKSTDIIFAKELYPDSLKEVNGFIEYPDEFYLT